MRCWEGHLAYLVGRTIVGRPRDRSMGVRGRQKRMIGIVSREMAVLDLNAAREGADERTSWVEADR